MLPTKGKQYLYKQESNAYINRKVITSTKKSNYRIGLGHNKNLFPNILLVLCHQRFTNLIPAFLVSKMEHLTLEEKMDLHERKCTKNEAQPPLLPLQTTPAVAPHKYS
jgi:hypothetical protein